MVRLTYVQHVKHSQALKLFFSYLPWLVVVDNCTHVQLQQAALPGVGVKELEHFLICKAINGEWGHSLPLVLKNAKISMNH